MTTTMHHRATNRVRSPVPGWNVAVVALCALAGILLWWTTTAVHRAASFHINTIVPKASLWHPDPGFYCAGVIDLSSASPNPQDVALVVNSAPTKAAHQATLRLYDDLVHMRSTTSDLTAVNAAYSCPR